jgi:elongation factor 1 alpha-like protein
MCWVSAIEVDDDTAPYAIAGQNVTLYLSGIDPIHLAIGSVLCPTSQPVPLVTKFTAQILVFDLQSPIITGTAVCPHFSPWVILTTRLNCSTIQSIYQLPSVNWYQSMKRAETFVRNQGQSLVLVFRGGLMNRVLQKGVTATVELSLRALPNNSRPATIPLETAAGNKEMGRVLIRRGGETIAAGMSPLFK